MSGRHRNPAGDELLEPQSRDSMQEWLEDCLRSLPDLEIRRMFGGAGVYSDGTMFGILAGGRVYLKTNEATQVGFVAQGMAPFSPRRGLQLKTYHEVPPDILADDGEFQQWASKALAVARVAPPRARARPTVSPEQILEG
jgi:DNA transformation protein